MCKLNLMFSCYLWERIVLVLLWLLILRLLMLWVRIHETRIFVSFRELKWVIWSHKVIKVRLLSEFLYNRRIFVIFSEMLNVVSLRKINFICKYVDHLFTLLSIFEGRLRKLHLVIALLLFSWLLCLFILLLRIRLLFLLLWFLTLLSCLNLIISLILVIFSFIWLFFMMFLVYPTFFFNFLENILKIFSAYLLGTFA